jgi:WD40 repeat protein
MQEETTLEVSNCDSVHNIRTFTHHSLVAAFGGKSILIAALKDGMFTTVCNLQQLDDLVLDFTILSASTTSTSTIECCVGYAHNFVDIATIEGGNRYTCNARVYCPELSVLFNMSFSHLNSAGRLTIASGTVFGKILLWEVAMTEKKSALLCRGTDHEGVIFRIKWSDDGQRLASVSDDRTLRLWCIIRQDTATASPPTALELLYTAWGHISRVWDVVFLSGVHVGIVATCSEDGTLKLWDGTGTCVSTLRGHSNDVWRLTSACSGSVLVSGGNDSAIKMWDVAYQLRTCPEDTESTVTSMPIPTWPRPLAKEPAAALSADNVDANAAPLPVPADADEEVDDLPIAPKKKKASASSRRANGVCGVYISPCLRWLVAVLVEGGMWMVDLSAEAAEEGLWIPVHHLNAVVSTADVLFMPAERDGTLRISIALAMLKVENVVLDVSVTGVGAHVESEQRWNAHDMRTVNTWFARGPDGSSTSLVTATVNGACSVWKLAAGTAPELWASCTTVSRAIATACLLVQRPEQSRLILGDARGSICIYALAGADAPLLAVFHKVHGSDPVSCIAGFDAGFVTAGHDGMLNVYTEAGNPSTGTPSWLHTAKLNCLPISTPDQIIVSATYDSSDAGAGLYVCGYHGSIYMVWDVRRGYQLMRVEGGGWKRPHRCALAVDVSSTSSSQLAVADFPAVLFVCPAPLLKDNTVLQLFGTKPTALKPTSAHVLHSIPLHQRSPGMGRVGYCATFVTASTSADTALKSDFLVVGGEDSYMKVFSVPDLGLRQEVSMSMNSSLKSLSSARSGASAHRGIVLGGGGKLQYYIWTYDRSVGCTAGAVLGAVLFTAKEGTVWSKATQDHRILSVQCAYLEQATLSLAHADLREDIVVERYAILLCDSRGAAVLGVFEHGVSDTRAPVPGRVRHNAFHVLQQIQPSQCPVLSSSLLLSESGDARVVAIFGDTAGTVSVWSAARSANR